MWVENAAETEIGDFDLKIFLVLTFKQNIFRFKVSMGDIFAVHVVYGQKDLFQDMCSFFLRKGLYLDYPVEKFATFQDLRDNIVVLLILQ